MNISSRDHAPSTGFALEAEPCCQGCPSPAGCGGVCMRIEEPEIYRLLTISDAEVLAESRAAGEDPEAIVDEMRRQIGLLLSSAKPAIGDKSRDTQ